ncbi:MAG: HEAT repeat domain-containing protein [Gallionella sp.]|nr:HEAT repeat domain-containing protein [Gallionella sp.]
MQPVLNRYLDKVIKDNQTIDARGVMQVNRMIELTMDEVFINLSVRMGKNENKPINSGLARTLLSGESSYLTGTILDTPISTRALTGTIFDDVITTQANSSLWSSIGFNPFAPQSIETGVSTDTLWSRHNAWVLLGDPGAGKTTLLKHFALQSARQCKKDQSTLPILIPLRLLAAEWDQQPSWTPQNAVLNYLSHKGLSEIGFNLEQERNELLEIFRKALAEGHALLLFDGLDEQRNIYMQRKTVAAIEAMLSLYSGNRFLVSSRIIGYDAAPLGSGFYAATLEPFNDEQMKAFFRQWIYAVEKHEDIAVDESTRKRAKEKADQLIEQVENNAGIRTLATNPLLCTIIGLIRRQGATLPQLRAELYKLCIDTFIFNWELQKRRREDQQGSLNKDQTQAVLEELALYFHENCPENRASQQAITDIIRDFLVRQEGISSESATHKASQLLSLIRDVSGLLIDRGNNEYGFFHLTFQEYLTARAITRRKRDIDRYLGQHLFEPRWREVIRLAAANQGMKDEETGSEFIETILRCKHPREEQMHYAFRLAFLCLKEAKVELETSDRMLQDWARIYLEQPELKTLLGQLIAQPGAKINYRADALLPLLDALKDKDDTVRRGAAEALGHIKDPSTVPALLVALKDKDDMVRWGAAEALGQIKDPSTVPALLVALKDKDDMVRWGAVQALGQIKAPSTVPALLVALKDKDEMVRWGAADALGQIKDPSTVPALLDALKDKDDIVRRGAAQALGQIKDPSTVPALLVALKDKGSMVRRGAAQALGQIKYPSTVPALLNAL